MFHKALWIKNYKQGKAVIWLMWAVSLLTLPIVHLFSANAIESWKNTWPGDWEYWFQFNYGTALFPLSALLILLASLLIGAERNNQGMDFMMALPFSRRDMFLSKWLFGALHIVSITLVNLILMFVVHQLTIHSNYLVFTPFITFFAFMPLSLLAVYSVALFIGTITGNFVSQILLTLIATVLPTALYTLISGMMAWHVNWIHGWRDTTLWFWQLHEFFGNLSLISIVHPWFNASHWNQPDFSFAPQLTNFIILGVYFVLFLLLGLVAYQKAPNENNGKVILFKKVEPIFLWGTVLCVALSSGEISASLLRGGNGWSVGIMAYYLGVVPAGIATYLLISKLLNKKSKFQKRS